jgi:uncharacterized protein YybS (DUF2232 family)
MVSLETVKSFLLTLLLSAFLFIGAMAIPAAGIALIPVVPQPALVFGLKYGRGMGALLLLTATVLLFFVGGRDLALGYSVLAVMTLLLLFSLGRDWPIEAIVAGAAAGMIAACFAVLLYLSGSFAQLRLAAETVLKENVETTLQLYERLGFSPESMELLREQTQDAVGIVLDIMPALAFAGFGGVILLNLLMLCRRFPHFRGTLLPGGDLKEWRAPEPLVWCLIVSGFALFLPEDWGFQPPALNLFLISSFLYFFQGLAIVAYYFHHKHVPLLLRGLGYALIVIEQIFALLVVGLGLFDLWGDFRRLKNKDLDASEA